MIETTKCTENTAHLLVKILELFVLVRDSHALKICVVADSLKVTAYEKQVDFIMMLRFEARYLGVDGVELAVAASFDCDLDKGAR